jgi:hypothetical protein
MTKTCIKCGIVGDDSLFAMRENRCHSCVQAYNRARYVAKKRKADAISSGELKFESFQCSRCGIDTCIDDAKSYPRCHKCVKLDRRVTQAKRYVTRKKIYHSWFDGKECVVCGESDPVVLEWAHDDRSTKSQNVSYLVTAARLSKAVQEADKCSIKCTNCHRKETADENDSWTSRYMRDGTIQESGPYWRQRAAKLDYLLSHPCMICQESDIRCLDLDHIDPSTKSFTIGLHNGLSWEKIEPELAKCQVLCANHHK